MLSLGEQQRLGIARALLHAPDYLFLDEATASLDEAAEAALYRLLQQRLPHATIVSIGHRSTLAAFHRRRLDIVARGPDHAVLSEAKLTPAEPATGGQKKSGGRRRPPPVRSERFASLTSGCRASGRPTAWR